MSGLKPNRCGVCGSTGWVARPVSGGMSMGPCTCKGGQAFKPEDFAWFMHAGVANAPDGLGRLILGVLKDGRQVLGQAFSPVELLAAVRTGSGKAPSDILLYCMLSELNRLNLRVGELEKKLAEGKP